MDLSALSMEEIRRLLAHDHAIKPFNERVETLRIVPQANRRAAVLMPLCKVEEAWHLVFTRRADTMAEHSGQVSFPGGSYEANDKDLVHTALRETWEEIGVPPEAIDVLGRLKSRELITGYQVTPIIDRIPWPYDFKLLTSEVSRVFIMPLSWLADPKNHTVRGHSYQGQTLQVFYFNAYEGEVLWGASASMTLELLAVLDLNGHLSG